MLRQTGVPKRRQRHALFTGEEHIFILSKNYYLLMLNVIINFIKYLLFYIMNITFLFIDFGKYYIKNYFNFTLMVKNFLIISSMFTSCTLFNF